MSTERKKRRMQGCGENGQSRGPSASEHVGAASESSCSTEEQIRTEGDETPAMIEVEAKSLPDIHQEPVRSEAERKVTKPMTVEPVSESLMQAVEAILLSTDKPVTAGRLAEAVESFERSPTAHVDADAVTPAAQLKRVRQAIAALNEQYVKTGRVFRIESLAGGYRVMTIPAMAKVLQAYHGVRERQSLSRAALETLAIIAYKQPMTRARLEAVRGVACGEILRSLSERRLVTIVGRAEELGRPILYGTTKAFLEAFGLASIKDLPSPEEFKARAETGEDE